MSFDPIKRHKLKSHQWFIEPLEEKTENALWELISKNGTIPIKRQIFYNGNATSGYDVSLDIAESMDTNKKTETHEFTPYYRLNANNPWMISKMGSKNVVGSSAQFNYFAKKIEQKTPRKRKAI